MMINVINISYCTMKLLPYVDKEFADYKDKSVQEFRFVISESIREQIFLPVSYKISNPKQNQYP